jgi:hypothetical protein
MYTSTLLASLVLIYSVGVHGDTGDLTQYRQSGVQSSDQCFGRGALNINNLPPGASDFNAAVQMSNVEHCGKCARVKCVGGINKQGGNAQCQGGSETVLFITNSCGGDTLCSVDTTQAGMLAVAGVANTRLPAEFDIIDCPATLGPQ